MKPHITSPTPQQQVSPEGRDPKEGEPLVKKPHVLSPGQECQLLTRTTSPQQEGEGKDP